LSEQLGDDAAVREAPVVAQFGGDVEHVVVFAERTHEAVVRLGRRVHPHRRRHRQRAVVLALAAVARADHRAQVVGDAPALVPDKGGEFFKFEII